MSILGILDELSLDKFNTADYAGVLMEFLEEELKHYDSGDIEDYFGFFCVVDPEEF